MGDSSEEELDNNPKGIEWDVELEIQLFMAMANHKPVGINKHFHMAAICEELRKATTQTITSADVWKHLGTIYDLSMLEETEPIPFPNEPVPFRLPETEFEELIKQKRREVMLSDEPEAGPSRKDILSALPTKTRKESGSSYASTDTQSIKSEVDYGISMDHRRDSQDSNTSGTRDSAISRKSALYKEKPSNPKVVSTTSWEAFIEEDTASRRGRRRGNNSTPSVTSSGKRRRT